MSKSDFSRLGSHLWCLVVGLGDVCTTVRLTCSTRSLPIMLSLKPFCVREFYHPICGKFLSIRPVKRLLNPRVTNPYMNLSGRFRSRLTLRMYEVVFFSFPCGKPQIPRLVRYGSL